MSLPRNARCSASRIADAHLGRVAVAREVHETRHESVELVASDEQAQSTPIAELQDPQGERDQPIGRESEHLVSRDRLQHVDERTLRVARGGKPDRAITAWAFRRTTGISLVVSL